MEMFFGVIMVIITLILILWAAGTVLGLLWASGILPQFILFVTGGAIFYGIGYIFSGNPIPGAILWLIIYLIACIIKIVDPEKRITILGDEIIDHEMEDVMEGWAGIVMLVLVFVGYFMYEYWDQISNLFESMNKYFKTIL